MSCYRTVNVGIKRRAWASDVLHRIHSMCDISRNVEQKHDDGDDKL